MGRKLIDLSGQRFGRLVAIEHIYKGNAWRVRCDCGKETTASGFALRSGATRSCGCLNSELAAQRKRTHGQTHTTEYRSWSAAKMRCTNPNDARWSDYGGRGIRMCDKWLDSFEAFYDDMGPKPPRHSLDRIDVDGHYEPGNCRWASPLVQANNCRSNVRITWRGETKPLQVWARELNVSWLMVYKRIFERGWTAEDAFTTAPLPNRKGRKNRPR